MTPRPSPALLRTRHALFHLLLAGLAWGSEITPATPAVVERIIADRFLVHEGRPHGIVADWANAPRVGTTINATISSVNMWGQVYMAVDGDRTALPSLRVEIKDVRLMCLTSDGVWHLLHAWPGVEGADFRADYAANEATTTDRIVHPTTGSWAVRLVPNRNFHFWSGGPNGGWSSIVPFEVGGVSRIVAMASSFQARLVDASGTGAPDPDAVARARIIASSGGDAKYKDGSFAWDWVQGRFRRLTPQWQAITASTASRDTLRTNPPPLYPFSDPLWNAPSPFPGWSSVQIGFPGMGPWLTGQNFDGAGYGASIPGWRVTGGVNRTDQRITGTTAAPNGTPAAIFDTMGGANPVPMTITANLGLPYKPGALYWLRFNLWKAATAHPYVGRFTYEVFAGDPALGGVRLGSNEVVGSVDGYEAWRNVSWPLSLMTNPATVTGTPNLFLQFTAEAPTNTTGLAQVQLDGIEVSEVGTPPSSSAHFDGATWTIRGDGSGFTNNSDMLSFVGRHVTGDHTLVTRIDSMSDPGGTAVGGLMMRETDSANARFVSVHRTGTGAVILRHRSTGAMTSVTASGTSAASTWLRLARVGNTVTASVGTDGQTWTLIGSPSVAFSTTPYLAGLVVSSTTRGQPNTVVFSSGIPASTPTVTAHPQAQTGLVGRTATFTAAGHGVPTPAYQWQRDGVDIPGATEPSYTTGPLAAGDDGASFRCRLSNNEGSVFTSSATLTVRGSIPGAVTQIRFYPRLHYQHRMFGGVFEGSNGSAEAGPYVPLYTIMQTPANGTWTTVTPTGGHLTAFRFLRYRAPTDSYGNVAEIEFLSNGVKLVGTGFGTPGSWQNGGSVFSRALDGDVATFFNSSEPSGAWVGIDLGPSANFGAWIADRGVIDTSPQADPDGDGIPNLLEYALGGNPALGEPALRPSVSTRLEAGRAYLTLTYSKNPAARGIVHIVETSSDLTTWSSGPTATTVLSESAESAMVRDNTPLDDPNSKRFIRLRVTAP